MTAEKGTSDPAYEKIGYETKIGKQRWAGPVFATSEGLYCLLDKSNTTSEMATRALKIGIGTAVGTVVGSPVVGMLAGAAIARATEQPANAVRLGKIGDAPEHLRRYKVGPLRHYKPDRAMLIVPRSAINMLVKSRWFNNTLECMRGGEIITISHRIFGQARVRRFLAESGWPLKWGKQEFNLPTRSPPTSPTPTS